MAIHTIEACMTSPSKYPNEYNQAATTSNFRRTDNFGGGAYAAGGHRTNRTNQSAEEGIENIKELLEKSKQVGLTKVQLNTITDK